MVILPINICGLSNDEYAIFPEEIKASVGEHFAWSVRIYWAFNQLQAFGEDPLDIMIDYRRRYKKDR